MTPTSDERREVANSLRFRAVVVVDFPYPIKYAQNSFWMEHTLREIVEAIGCAGNQYPAQWLVRLADLIDPTCKVESIEPIRYGEFNQAVGSAFSLSCGHTVMRACTDMPPAFCDECGARVVTRDGDE